MLGCFVVGGFFLSFEGVGKKKKPAISDIYFTFTFLSYFWI